VSWYDDPDRILAPIGQLTSKDRSRRRHLKARERWYRKAYQVGLEGFAWQPDLWGWPSGDDIYQAYLSGCDERRARRRDRMVAGLAKMGRGLAPKTTKRIRRVRRRWK
jgi:hypothetical protein